MVPEVDSGPFISNCRINSLFIFILCNLLLNIFNCSLFGNMYGMISRGGEANDLR